MSVFVAKMVSRVSLPFIVETAVLPSPYVMSVLCQRLAAFKKELVIPVFLAIAILGAVVYVVEVNLMILGGKRLARNQAVLKELEHEQKLKYAALTAVRSPSLVKKEAVEGMRMVEISDIRYIGAAESVAANDVSMP